MIIHTYEMVFANIWLVLMKVNKHVSTRKPFPKICQSEYMNSQSEIFQTPHHCITIKHFNNNILNV